MSSSYIIEEINFALGSYKEVIKNASDF